MHFNPCRIRPLLGFIAILRRHYDLVINLVAITVDTVCVGSILFILVTSSCRRIVGMMFCLSLRVNSDYVAVITSVILMSLISIT